jgi:putative ABC transport system permease protein
MTQDLFFALRTFRNSPILTATIIICLALGIGGTTAVFSVINGVLLQKLPYPDADRLVLLRTVNAENTFEAGRLSLAELRDWQAAAHSFQAIAGYRWMTVDLVDSERSERLQGLWVTPEFFRMFGLQPSVGHAFQAGDPRGIVLGRGVWQRRFGSDPAIAGRTIPIGICCPQQPETARMPIAGAIGRDVAFPPTLRGLRDRGHGLNDTIDYWAPLDVQNAKRPGFREIEAVAKLKTDVTPAQAQVDMDSIARQLAENFPDTNRGWTIRVMPITDELFASARPLLFLLMTGAAFVLLIACANVAVLLTFNAVRRFHEVAVRTALGASAGRIIREFLMESLILAICGGAAGLLVAIAGRRLLVSLAPAGVPRLNETSIDGHVFGFALAATLICGVIIGLIPAFRVLKFDLESTLRAENSKTSTSHARARTYEPLLVLQVALTLALLIGSGLMFKSLNRLLAVSPGFRASNVITATLSLPSAKHAWSYNSRFIERVIDRVREIPRIEAVGGIRGIPLNEVRFYGPFSRLDKPADPSRAPLATIRVISEDYFRAMGIPVLSGRDFVRQDGVGEIGHTKVIIINDVLVRLVWPGENPVGQKDKSGSEVVGVVGGVRYASLNSVPVPEVYYPEGTYPQDEFSLVIRTAADPLSMRESIRSAIQEVERDVFIVPFQSMDEVVANSASANQFAMRLLSVFSGIGVLLAVIGIAGIVAYSLSLRVREVGIRVAMGAGPGDVIALISRQGLLPALMGLAFGCLLAFGLTRFLRGLLYNVSPYDPLVFSSAFITLAAISVLSAGIAAYRASRVDAASILK